MNIQVVRISDDQANRVMMASESQFADVKAAEITPSKLSRTISAFANSDGGDLYVGISEADVTKVRSWKGFHDEEAANDHVATFEQISPLGTNLHYTFLQCDGRPGLVLHIQVNKSKGIVKASNGIPYTRANAASVPCSSPESVKKLDYLKGITSFETELASCTASAITDSTVITDFLTEVVPTAQPEAWLKKQMLIADDRPTVAGVLLFAEEPQAILPKRCGVKIYRYKTREPEGFRAALAFDPKTVEGCLYAQIIEAVKVTTEIAESIPKLGEEGLGQIKYPTVTLHEIITNAVIHRDYSIADDVHIRIFENRIEVQSPGRLPAHITTQNIKDERFARNGAIVRILNKFKDAPNKDVGEGLNTAFDAMHELGLKEPTIIEKDNSVLVIIRHEPLASPIEAIMDYLEINGTIKNAQAREITHVRADYQIKGIFKKMVDSNMIEQVPGTRTSNTAYRKIIPSSPEIKADETISFRVDLFEP